jgi:hypothetical protein
VGQENLKIFITAYYKVFGALAVKYFTWREEITHDISLLYEHENNILTPHFTEEEVFKAISQMERNKAPGPDGFHAKCCQIWLVIKMNMMVMFAQLQYVSCHYTN